MSLFCAYKQELVVTLFVLIETYPIQLEFSPCIKYMKIRHMIACGETGRNFVKLIKAKLRQFVFL